MKSLDPSWDVVWLELVKLELLRLDVGGLEMVQLNVEELGLEELELAAALSSSYPTVRDSSSLWASSLHRSTMLWMMPWTSCAVCP